MTVTMQAAEWVVTISEMKASPEERRRFVRWLKQSPKHIAQALFVSTVLGLIREARHELPKSALQPAFVTPVRPTPNGVLIEAVSIPWMRLVSLFERDPSLVHQLHWRTWEEIVAAAYERQGYEVELTPRSNDGGRDVIAVRCDIGTIRIFDQVKAFRPDRFVTASDVRAMLGVLSAESNVSKGFITTTSDFSPGIYKNPALTRYMPYRLELRARDSLIAWLTHVRNRISDLADCGRLR